MDAPPRELIFAQTEDYVEYNRHGKVLKGDENPVVRSRYEEDVLINNHTSIWGSYWNAGNWGFRCCHSFVKNSYCTGAAGKEANKACLSLLPPKDADAAEPTGETEEIKEDKEKKKNESSSSEDEEAKAKAEKKRKKREKKKRKKDKKHKKKKKRKSSS